MYKFSYEPISFHQQITYNCKVVRVNNILELKLNENALQITIIINEITMKYIIGAGTSYMCSVLC